MSHHTADVGDAFATHRTEPEAEWSIAALADSDPPLRLAIAAAGGGTPGRRYAHNDWIYGLWLGGRLQRSGTDLRSGATGRTHHQMAVLLADHLTGETAGAAIDERTRQRLAAWTAQQHLERPSERTFTPCSTYGTTTPCTSTTATTT